jgi:hypothetical protein
MQNKGNYGVFNMVGLQTVLIKIQSGNTANFMWGNQDTICKKGEYNDASSTCSNINLICNFRNMSNKLCYL